MPIESNSPENLKQQLLYEVNKIPAGKVLSYGEIGAKVGISGWIAGRILSGMTEEEMKNYAWQRVVNKQGYISALKLGFRGNLQIELLRAEGIEIPDSTVDMVVYSWRGE
jgi:methylated-DNA-protein-cysteine methyltransferase related protein